MLSAAAQRLRHSRINGETKFFGALAAQVAFRKLIYVGRDNIERWTMPDAAARIADEEAFAHVPGMGKEAPFRRDDGHAFAAGGFAGERRNDPGDRDDAGGDVPEKLASCFHRSFQVRHRRAQSRCHTSPAREFLRPAVNLALAGGRERIRTSGRVTPTPDFESGAFNHSATLPLTY